MFGGIYYDPPIAEWTTYPVVLPVLFLLQPVLVAGEEVSHGLWEVHLLQDPTVQAFDAGSERIRLVLDLENHAQELVHRLGAVWCPLDLCNNIHYYILVGASLAPLVNATTLAHDMRGERHAWYTAWHGFPVEGMSAGRVVARGSTLDAEGVSSLLRLHVEVPLDARGAKDVSTGEDDGLVALADFLLNDVILREDGHVGAADSTLDREVLELDLVAVDAGFQVGPVAVFGVLCDVWCIVGNLAPVLIVVEVLQNTDCVFGVGRGDVAEESGDVFTHDGRFGRR